NSSSNPSSTASEPAHQTVDSKAI
ncbi:uncharacterized protein METZ01_LOCUS290818, partial [marine metagenome]